MMRSFIHLVAGLAFLASSSIALADDISLGEPGYGGSGCPAGSASVTLSPDQKSLSILFDRYVVEAGGMTGKTLDRKSCNLAIPVHVPQGYSIALFQLDYRGFNALPFGARSQFNVEYFFAGGRGPRQSKKFRGPTSENFELTDLLTGEALVWTPCGANTNLRVNTNMLVQTNRRMDEAFAMIDSADFMAGLTYHIQWRRCR